MQNRKHVLRFIIFFLVLIVCLIAFSIKLLLIQIFHSSHLAGLAEKQHKHLIEIEPIRGSIYDRNERLLAFNVSSHSLFANPRMMSAENKERAVQELSVLLKMDPQIIRERLDKKKYFVWIKRKLPLALVNKIKELDISGLDFRKESKRHYPNGELLSHLMGFAGIDNEGLEGLERGYDDELKGKPGWMRILRDAKQRNLLIKDSFIAPQNGFHLVLTIDETIQYIAERALKKAYEKHNAKGATIVVMNVKTGEILALANMPTYNLESYEKSSETSRTNRAIHYVYEPGSVFKIVTASAALEEEKFVEGDKIFCENGEYRVANHILHDHHPHGTLTFSDVFKLSSNIGVTKIAQKLGPSTIYKYAQRFRFGKETNIGIKGEVKGVLKHPRAWSRTTIGAIPIGHEVTVTPVQLVCAIGALANDGVFMKPFVVKYIKDSQGHTIKEFSPQIVDRVISEDTARRVTDILIGVVEEGTGKRARIRGVKVAGKTGTAQKVIDGTYSHSKFYATFFGFAPADNPQIAAVVVFDEPHPSYFGGTVSAPVFKEVVENSLKYLGM